MSVVGNLSRHLHFAEFDSPLQTGAGWLSPAQRKAKARENLGLSGSGSTVSPQASPTGLTDNSGGTASGTIAAISASPTQAEVANAVASLAAQVGAIRSALVDAGVLTE